MPLSAPAPRENLHDRNIALRGFRREDGLFDIEAHLVDTKSYAFGNLDRGTIEPGVPLHGMWARMTVDEDMLIVAFEASMDFTPYNICPGAAPGFASLAGLRIGKGFVRLAMERVGGTKGCTHLRELLQPMATVAFQTMVGIRRKRDDAGATVQSHGAQPNTQEAAQDAKPARPPILDTCLAYATNSPVVKRTWPHLYTGPDRAEAS